MLKAVIQQKEVRFKLLPGGHPRRITAGAGVNRHSGQGPGQPVRLFSHLRGFFIGMPAVGNAGDAMALPAVAPAEDGHPLTPVPPQPGQAGHHGGLAGAAHRQVPHAHHRGRQVFRPEQTPGVQGAPPPGPQAIEPGQDGGAVAEGGAGRRAGALVSLEPLEQVMPIRAHTLLWGFTLPATICGMKESPKFL